MSARRIEIAAAAWAIAVSAYVLYLCFFYRPH
jgi:hypothetical protein